jgi:hypothetical protein
MSVEDEEMLQTLRALASDRDEAMPPNARAAARAAFTWRTVDDELALLGYDSALDTDALAGVRGDGVRLLTFEAPGVAIDVEVSDGAGSRTLLGQASGSVTHLQLQRPDDAPSRGIDVDALGTFRADDVAPGVIRIRCLLDETAGGPRIVSTEWVAI